MFILFFLLRKAFAVIHSNQDHTDQSFCQLHPSEFCLVTQAPLMPRSRLPAGLTGHFYFGDPRLTPDMRTRRPYPQHPYPVLLSTPTDYTPAPSASFNPLSKKARKIIATLRKGGRILFDMKEGRALLYRIRQGLEHVTELTVRMLATLVKQGYLIMERREGRLVHYVPAASIGT